MRLMLQYLLPHKIISLIARLCANCKIVWVKNYLISDFLTRYNVNMQEAIETNPLAYDCYNSFFTRELKAELRPIDAGSNSVVSPADGLIAQIGNIQQQNIIQAKGHNYSVLDLLGGDTINAANFNNGSFATIYLAPHDYHRVHMPLTGRLTQMQYIPGKLFSVNTHAAENIPNLFARNERVVTMYETNAGKMAVILVGAMIVGSIETIWAGTICPPHFTSINTWQYENNDFQHIEIAKGAEMGRFKLGSTVIVLFEQNSVVWEQTARINGLVKIGQKIGNFSNRRI